jgi:uncharacterized membrane protein
MCNENHLGRLVGVLAVLAVVLLIASEWYSWLCYPSVIVAGCAAAVYAVMLDRMRR